MGLSICYTVYNQRELLKERLDSLKAIQASEVEIVISDDNSTENIKELVETYGNAKFRYIKTPKNLGHDLNILFALENAKYDYVLILRTRDNINPDAVNDIIRIVESRSDVGYYLFSANWEGKTRLRFKDKVYMCGSETIEANYSLPEHPSGNIYNKKLLRLTLYKKYIKEFFDNIYGFDVHNLMRLDLSTKSNFLTSQTVGWLYADTLKAEDTAVNSTKTGINVYAPAYCFPRYKCEFTFAKNELNRNIRLQYLKRIVRKYYWFVIGRSKTIINDKRYSTHYNSKKEKMSRIYVARELDKITIALIADLTNDEKREILAMIKPLKFKYIFTYPIWEIFRNLFINTPVYSFYRYVKSNTVR